MGDFSADWLALREPADHRARSARLARAVAERVPPDRAKRIVDLGAGAGSNVRYLAAFLGAHQKWRLFDRDAALLRSAARHAPAGIPGLAADAVDLAKLDAALANELFDRAALVTGSALLDLVSARWIETVARGCRVAGAAALFALSYDGRTVCTPADRDDERIRTLVNRHQRTDKGFGPALGPDAAEVAAQSFTQQGFVVERERSDWTLGAADGDLQRQLIGGWASAAGEVSSGDRSFVESWRRRRLDHIDHASSTLVVGHEDLAAWLK